MVLTGKRYLESDIWLEISNQAEGTDDIMRTV